MFCHLSGKRASTKVHIKMKIIFPAMSFSALSCQFLCVSAAPFVCVCVIMRMYASDVLSRLLYPPLYMLECGPPSSTRANRERKGKNPRKNEYNFFLLFHFWQWASESKVKALYLTLFFLCLWFWSFLRWQGKLRLERDTHIHTHIHLSISGLPLWLSLENGIWPQIVSLSLCLLSLSVSFLFNILVLFLCRLKLPHS